MNEENPNYSMYFVNNIDFPVPEQMFTNVANKIEDLNSFGITLGLPGNVMNGIIESSKSKDEIIKDLFQVNETNRLGNS